MAAAWLVMSGSVLAQEAIEPGIQLQLSSTLAPPPRGDAARQLPIIVQARELRGRPDLETVAEGDAEFRRGGMVIRADRLSYDHPDDLAVAHGNVRVSRDGFAIRQDESKLVVRGRF